MSSVSATTSSAGALGTGVTATAIRVGITYPDLTQLNQTLHLDGGNYQVAFTTVINNVNAHGGINGRKIVPYFAGVNVIGTAAAAVACTQLIEDDKVFAIIGFFQAADTACYITNHDVPIVGASLTKAEDQGVKAPWFNNLLADDHLIPKELTILKKQGVFAGHKVAVVGAAADQATLEGVVLPQLNALHVNVVQTAINDVPNGDTAALTQQYGLIAQKFQASGVDVVVAVGDAGDQWPNSLKINKSTYAPRLVGTTYTTMSLFMTDKTEYNATYAKEAVAATNIPPATIAWNDPAMKRCVAMIQKAEPNATIGNPITSKSQTETTWVAPETACQYVTLFVDIAKAAGSTLNNSTFLRGGESLANITLPGSGGTLHYGPGHHDGNGPLFVYTWDTGTDSFKVKVANT